MNLPVRPIFWKRSRRIIQDRYPTISLYQGISPPEDWRALERLEALTNPRLRSERGEIHLLRRGDHFPTGKGSYNIRAPFAHASASRFSDGRYGVYYTARTLATAVAEKVHSTTRFLNATQESPMAHRMRVLLSEVRGRFHDLRGFRRRLPRIYAPDRYDASQALGFELWRKGSEGIVYESVRYAGGQCAAVFSPQTVRHPRQERCLIFDWDGSAVRSVFELQEYPRP